MLLESLKMVYRKWEIEHNWNFTLKDLREAVCSIDANGKRKIGHYPIHHVFLSIGCQKMRNEVDFFPR